MNIHEVLDYCMHSPGNTNKMILIEMLERLGGQPDGHFSIKDVADYVMHTKWNTNRAVLETMLRNLEGDIPPEPPVKPKRTVLYNDGTFIINELPEDKEENERIHGGIDAEYPPLDVTHNYVFNSNTDRYWHTKRKSIKNIKFGSEIKPVSMGHWFRNCDNLVSFDATNCNTSNVMDMSRMFSNCYALTSLNISGFDTSNVTNMTFMFSGCAELKTIYATEDFVTTAVVSTENNMFLDCTSIVGGAGTTYNSFYTDTSHARIDNPPVEPGYFTLKS